MHKKFLKYTNNLKDKYIELMGSQPIKMEDLKNQKNIPTGGVYVFSEGKNHLYVGRTKREITKRIKGHVNTSKDCSIAFRIARDETWYTKAAYGGKYTRKKLLEIRKFKREYQKAKKRIKKMDIRLIEETHPIRQSLLEIYTAVMRKTKYNDFSTS